MAVITLGSSCILVLLCYHVLSRDVHRDRRYVAAVYEHHVILNSNPTIITDRKSALELMDRNLDIYEEQVITATKQVE